MEFIIIIIIISSSSSSILLLLFICILFMYVLFFSLVFLTLYFALNYCLCSSAFSLAFISFSYPFMEFNPSCQHVPEADILLLL
jgi:hypothetical protein